MGIKIKNLQTGEFEKFNIPALKGEKGEPGEIEPSEKVDYIGKQHSKLRDTMNANVDYIIKTAIGEFNYLDYEGQHITATNSIEGHAKSVILSGQTLVNICKNSGKDLIYTNKNSSTSLCYKIKDNTWYYLIINVKQNTLNKPFRFSGWTLAHGATPMSGSEIGASDKDVFDVGETGVKRFKIGYSNIPEDKGKSLIMFTADSSTVTGQATYDIMFLEYQEGMENWDIPYFEGIQSVKMPVLTTTGKNLFDGNLINGYYEDGTLNKIIGGNANLYKTIKLNLKKGTYTFSFEESVRFIRQLKDGVYGTLGGDFTKFTTTLQTDGIYVLSFRKTDNTDFDLTKIQIEQGTQATEYEPYKSNILTVNEPVELRGIRNVQDTLDCLTGEKVERVGEVVLDGSENWVYEPTYTNENVYGCYILLHQLSQPPKPSNFNFANNVFPNITNSSYQSEGFATNPGTLSLRIAKDKLESADVSGFKKYLQNHPVTLQYPLATEVVKTVDLSDNHVYSYGSTTHYSCSSEESSLVPTLSVKVPTDTQLTIQEQKATTQTLLIKNMDLQQSIKEVQAMNLAFNTALYNSFNSIREEVEDIKKHVSTNENLEGSF